MTRIRINNVFKKFLSEFHQRTIRDSNITAYDLKIKYLATLEGLTSGLGSEVFEPISLIVAQEGELFNGGYYGTFSDQIIILYQSWMGFYQYKYNWQYTKQIKFKSVGKKTTCEIVKQAFGLVKLFHFPVLLLWVNTCMVILGYCNKTTSQDQNTQTSRDMQVLVTGTTGISWRKKPDTVSETVCDHSKLCQQFRSSTILPFDWLKQQQMILKCSPCVTFRHRWSPRTSPSQRRARLMGSGKATEKKRRMKDGRCSATSMRSPMP